ncbi:MAG: methylated-DNA--[protein]-cysteine S-methyltransferase [Clostridia bacterium]|nr:methylated-DNA--[protein]-cysteine S-methyltransferase [Clostridia bacterium]
MDYINEYSSPLGKIILASDGTALTGLWFDGQKYCGGGSDAGDEDVPVTGLEAADRKCCFGVLGAGDEAGAGTWRGNDAPGGSVPPGPEAAGQKYCAAGLSAGGSGAFDVGQKSSESAKTLAASLRNSAARFGADKLTDDVGGSGAEYEERQLPVFELAADWLDVYFAGKRPCFTPPLLMRGTRFRREVWEILLSIPYGNTVTYGEIADGISKQRGGGRVSAQAVGGAVAHNPISLIVPCHRVIGADGSLTGYAGGLDRKARLLELEGARRPE